MKKLIIFLLAVVCALGLAGCTQQELSDPKISDAQATDTVDYPTPEQKEAILEAIGHSEYLNDELGVEEVIDLDLSVGEAIHIYNYTADGFVLSRLAFPIFMDSELAILATERDDGKFQVSTTLIESILATDKLTIALVYDAETCRLYDGKEWILLHHLSMTVDNREILPIGESTPEFETSDIQLCDLTRSTALHSVA